jgi:hypothetical protein
MATFKSTVYTYQNGEVQGAPKADIGALNGVVRTLQFSHTFGQAVIAIADVIKLCQLPKGARPVGGQIYITSTGTTGIFKYGYAASLDLDSSGTTLEAADDDAFSTAADLDSGGQVVDYKMVGADAAFLKKFAGKVDVQLEATEATDAATTDTISGYIAYVID